MYYRRTNLWQISCWRDEPISDSRYKEGVVAGYTVSLRVHLATTYHWSYQTQTPFQSLANTYNYPGLLLGQGLFSQLVEEDGHIHPATSDDPLWPGGDDSEGQQFSPRFPNGGPEADGLELGMQTVWLALRTLTYSDSPQTPASNNNTNKCPTTTIAIVNTITMTAMKPFIERHLKQMKMQTVTKAHICWSLLDKRPKTTLHNSNIYWLLF